MYDWEKLYASDESVIYAGFAAARNMTIKVEGIEVAYSDPGQILLDKKGPFA